MDGTSYKERCSLPLRGFAGSSRGPRSQFSNRDAAPQSRKRGIPISGLLLFHTAVPSEGTPSRFPAQAANRKTSAVPSCVDLCCRLYLPSAAQLWTLGAAPSASGLRVTRRYLDDAPIDIALTPRWSGFACPPPRGVGTTSSWVCVIPGICSLPGPSLAVGWAGRLRPRRSPSLFGRALSAARDGQSEISKRYLLILVLSAFAGPSGFQPGGAGGRTSAS